MLRTRNTLPALGLVLFAVGAARGQTLEPVDADKLRQRPVTTVGGAVGDLLKQWYKDGTAAGNVGDYYDNRDGDHSPLNRGLFPQLLTVKYSADDIRLKKHWAAQNKIHPAVVFGNSSTSAPPTAGGSNPRSYFCHPRGLPFLAEEYAKNNLYIYPEHRDHDPGHNGKGDGYGDLYPTNTPYLIISQGSSGSDQPFMRAVPLTLAAFRPDVKKKLTEAGALMPTLQMIFRSTNKHLKGPGEYLTGKAHPSVFEGSWVDELAMVKMAHALEAKVLPPLVELKVIAENPAPHLGVDYFESALLGEKLADTPAVIARIHRGKERARRLVVSAEGSRDLNGAPLTYKWVILRGDPERIRIQPRNPEGSVAEITVAYQERRPIAPGAAMASNRVDIGVFVHNGTYHSAPAFVTFYTLDSETRTYDGKGRVVEIGYNSGETDVRVTDWPRVLSMLATDARVTKLLGIDDAKAKAIAALSKRYEELNLQRITAQRKVTEAETAEKRADNIERARKEMSAARNELNAIQQKANAVLDDNQPALGGSVRRYFDDAVHRVTRDPDFQKKHPEVAESIRGRYPADRLPHAGLLKELKSLGVDRPNAPRTAYDLAQLERLHATMLVQDVFFKAAEVSYQPNFVDQRLSAPKRWRDVYHYDASGAGTGWTRYHPDHAAEEFNHEGLLVVENDDLGRCKKARTLRYTRDLAKGFPSSNPVRMEPGDTFVLYSFAGPDDRRGKRAGTEPAK